MIEALRRDSGPVHWLVVLGVFAITGSLSVVLSRLLLHDLLGLQGGFRDGPWSYRLVYLLLIPPCYSALLATIGTLVGKGAYFRARVVRMWRRLLPRPLGDRLFGRAEATQREGATPG